MIMTNQNQFEPFDFVPLSRMETDTRKMPVGHMPPESSFDSLPLFSGNYTCQITNFSPLCVDPKSPFIDVKDNRILLGSSVKGVIRSVAEAASNSCMLRCRNPDHLCPTCRIFGMIGVSQGGSSSDDKSKGPNAFRSKVRFSDAVPESKYEPILLSIPESKRSSGRTKHGRSAQGRIFFRHNVALGRQWHGKENGHSLEGVLDIGSKFVFEVSWLNLTADELNLLTYALELEPAPDFDFNKPGFGVYHKMGYAKRHGLGSVCIEIFKAQDFVPELWYTAKQPSLENNTAPQADHGWTTYADEAVRQVVKARKQAFLDTHKNKPYLTKLREILTYDPGN